MLTNTKETITATLRSPLEEWEADYGLLLNLNITVSLYHQCNIPWRACIELACGHACQWGIFLLVGMDGPAHVPPWAGGPEVCVYKEGIIGNW